MYTISGIQISNLDTSVNTIATSFIVQWVDGTIHNNIIIKTDYHCCYYFFFFLKITNLIKYIYNYSKKKNRAILTIISRYCIFILSRIFILYIPGNTTPPSSLNRPNHPSSEGREHPRWVPRCQLGRHHANKTAAAAVIYHRRFSRRPADGAAWQAGPPLSAGRYLKGLNRGLITVIIDIIKRL